METFMRPIVALFRLFPFVLLITAYPVDALKLIKTIRGGISAKSIQHNGHGLFFAQNMFYSNNIKVYNRNFEPVKTIDDRIKLSDYGYKKYPGYYTGGPVEAAFSHDGKYVWVSQYYMIGKASKRPGRDSCRAKDKYDDSFLYVINTKTLTVEHVVKVGAVPKAISVSPDNKWVFVANWCGGDLSVVDIEKKKEVRRIYLGPHPRDSIVDRQSKKVYVSIMGGNRIAVINLDNYKVSWIKNIPAGSRAVRLSPDQKYLYASLKWSNWVAKVDLRTRKIVKKVRTGRGPASMEITPDGRYLYIVNYYSGTVSKVRTRDMKLLKTARAKPKAVGLTYDPLTKRVWVSCYSGFILVYQD